MGGLEVGKRQIHLATVITAPAWGQNHQGGTIFKTDILQQSLALGIQPLSVVQDHQKRSLGNEEADKLAKSLCLLFFPDAHLNALPQG